MYAFLTRYTGVKVAGILTGFWYVGLIVLVLYYVLLPNGQFRYANW
ncbi:hypothetical protein [Hymenobacter sp. IS2118]|nr:hypothetical protein [Hymenobacter sp. IS2118]